MNILLCLALTTISLNALASKREEPTWFMPKNNLSIPVREGVNSAGLSESQFNAVIDRIETIYSPVFEQKGGTLVLNRNWKDGTVNASAERDGDQWNVNMYGGLARHKAITEDGFSLVLCHEIGHHIGGAPKANDIFGSSRWASNEGQSDYWGVLKCLRQTFVNDDNESIVKKLDSSEFLRKACSKTHPNKNDANICIRTGMAGVSVANLFTEISNGKAAKFETPDTEVVSRTNSSHPKTQCRLDTMFQASLCEVAFTEDVDQKDESIGTCNKSRGHEIGTRPLCWFKPKK